MNVKLITTFSAIGFLIGSFTEIKLALFMGAFFGLISWAFTGFNIKNNKDNHYETAMDSKLTDSVKTTINDLSPVDLGKFIIQILFESEKHRTLSPTEVKLLEKINLSVSKYSEEIILLEICAQLSAISQSINKKELKEQIAKGYWIEFEKVKPALNLSHDFKSKLKIRYAEYAKFFLSDLQPSVGSNVSKIALNFAEFIDVKDKGNAFLLAACVADSTFYTLHENTLSILLSNKYYPKTSNM